ncbi:MAG: GGDEF domain-containing protein [Glaciecola sp.]
MKEAIVRYLRVGITASTDYEKSQRLLVSNLFAFIGYTITFTLAISAFLRGNLPLSIALLISSSVFFFCHQIHRFPSLGNTLNISTRVLYLCLIVLILWLVYSGGNANTGPLWMYLVPPVAFHFYGLKKGIQNLILFLIVVAVMLFSPGNSLLATEYQTQFSLRLIYSFITVTLLFGFYEYSRQKSFQFIQKLSDKFERQAMHDPLTKLPNRRGMREYLKHEYERSKRSNQPLSVMLCDIDYFKKINDEHMHDGGDHVLEQLAVFFKQAVRKQDSVARWGGEEFLFLLPETNDTDAFKLAEKIRNQLQSTSFTYKGKSISVTLSIGLKQITPDVNIDQAINIADHYLFEAKKHGRNQTHPAYKKAS